MLIGIKTKLSIRMIGCLLCLFLVGGIFGGCNVGKKESEAYIPDWVLGGWQVDNKEGKPITIRVYPDGSVLSNVGDIGSWYYVDKRLYIVWIDGWTDVIVNEGGKYKKLGFAPGVATDAKPTNSSKAEKLHNAEVKIQDSK